MIAGTNVCLALAGLRRAAAALADGRGRARLRRHLRRRPGPVDGGPAPPDRWAGRPPGGPHTTCGWCVAASPRRPARLDGRPGLSGRALGDGFVGSLVSLAAGGLVLLAVYVGVARALQVAELTALLARCGSARGADRRRSAQGGPVRPSDKTMRSALHHRPLCREPGDDRGDIVLGWLTKLVVVLGLVGHRALRRHLGRHHGERLATRATTPPARRRDLAATKDLQQAYLAAAAAADRAEPRRTSCRPEELHASTRTARSTWWSAGGADPGPLPLGPHGRVGARQPRRRRAAASPDRAAPQD